MSDNDFSLADLAQVVSERAAASPDDSYTAKLLDKGIGLVARKTGEEAVELMVAAFEESDERVTSEAADLLYHVLVLLQARGLTLADVEAELGRRHR